MEQGTKYLWEGAVGIKISTRVNRVTDRPFYTFELTRCFKRDGSEEMEYTQRFTPRHTEAIASVIQQALMYMHENPLEPAAEAA